MKNFTALLFLLPEMLLSQVMFQKSYGPGCTDHGKFVQQTQDGGYILLGEKWIGNMDFDILLIKTNAVGDTLWSKIYRGDSLERGRCVRQTNDGGYIVVGSTNSFGSGGDDVYLIKTNQTGDTLWTKVIGGVKGEIGFDIHQTSDGGYVIAGGTSSYGSGNEDAYVIKTDGGGNIVWAKTYGSASDEGAWSIQELPNGGYVAAGGRMANGLNNIFLYRIDSGGNLVWSKMFSNSSYDFARKVYRTSGGNYAVFGLSGGNISGPFVLLTDTSGNMQWGKIYTNNSATLEDGGEETSDGGFILTSTANGVGSLQFIKAKPNGDTLFTRRYTTGIMENHSEAIQQTTDKGFIILGMDHNANAWLIKTDSLGNSGCNQVSSNVVVNGYSPAVSMPATAVSSGGVAGSTSTKVLSGCTVTTYCYTGIYEIENNKTISIFPNPLTTSATIKIDAPQTFANTTAQLYDMLGNKVSEVKLQNNQATLQRGNLPSGIYFYKVISENTVIGQGKVAVE